MIMTEDRLVAAGSSRDNDPVPDWDGVGYRRVSGLQQWLAERAIAALDLGDARTVLDIGCGDGRITAEIAARIPAGRVVGVDPSPRMISIAPSAPNLSFELGDVLGLRYERQFELVVSFNALHWVADQAAALARIEAALTRPGRAGLVFVCAGDRASLEDVAMRATTTARWRGYFAGFTAPFTHPEPTVWAQQARDHGLRVDEVTTEDLEWDFGSRETFTSWCTVGFGAWTERLPDQAIGEFVDDVVTDYAREIGSDAQFRFRQLRAALVRTAD
jgi:trans-aconitate 2-methyltransferase